MGFHEIRFPLDVAFGASGGPERRTEIVTLGSGHEERNTPWKSSRRKYNAGYGVKSLADLYAVLTFFGTSGTSSRVPLERPAGLFINDPRPCRHLPGSGIGDR